MLFLLFYVLPMIICIWYGIVMFNKEKVAQGLVYLFCSMLPAGNIIAAVAAVSLYRMEKKN